MSSYASTYIARHEVFTYRNAVSPEVSQLFSSTELSHLTGSEALAFSSEWNAGILDQEDIAENGVFVYISHAGAIRDRLDTLGFGDELVRAVIESWVSDLLEQARSAAEHCIYDAPMLQGHYEEEIARLARFEYATWLDEVRTHIAAKQDADTRDLWDNGPLKDFDEIDHRVILKIVLNGVAGDEVVTLDIDELVRSGYIEIADINDGSRENAWTVSDSPPIVITEGRTDAEALKGALEVLRPHLVGFIRFLDFDTGNEGGASAAVRLVKGFAAAGVSNRVIALFDNDSAAHRPR